VSELLSDEHIYEIMNKCKIGKWQEEDENYRIRTIKNAREWLRQKKFEEVKNKTKRYGKKKFKMKLIAIINNYRTEQRGWKHLLVSSIFFSADEV